MILHMADDGGRRWRFVNGIQKPSQLGQGKACWSIIGSNLVKGFSGTLQDQELTMIFGNFVHDVGM